MAEYMTKQRKLLMDYLISHTDETLPTSRIVEALSDEGISPSAIYRNLSALEKKGKLFRTVAPGSQELSYRYIGAEKCKGIVHLSCLHCGKTAHMEQEDADLLPAAAGLLAAWIVRYPGVASSTEPSAFSRPHTLIALRVKLSD